MYAVLHCVNADLKMTLKLLNVMFSYSSGKDHVGGNSDLHKLFTTGKLEDMILEATRSTGEL